MTNRENYLSIARRTGYDYMPVHVEMCPVLRDKFNAYVREHDLKLPSGEGSVHRSSHDRCPRRDFSDNIL